MWSCAITSVCWFQVVWVPGSFEIPLLAKAMAKSGKFDAILTIGTVVSFIMPTIAFD